MKDISSNYITIQGWMVKDLGLKSNELLIFALIFGFCQDDQTEFTGSLNYIAEWTNTSRQTVIKSISELVGRNLIIKRVEYINGVTFNRYKINILGVKKLDGDSQNSLLGVVKKLDGGSQKTLPYNTNNNIIDNTNNNIESNFDFFIENKDEKYPSKKNNYIDSQIEEVKKILLEKKEIELVIDWIKYKLEVKKYRYKTHAYISQFKADLSDFGYDAVCLAIKEAKAREWASYFIKKDVLKTVANKNKMVY